jgi:TPR repeat protein
MHVLCLGFGKGIETDLSRAAETYQGAADKGDFVAQRNFDFCLQPGLGPDVDL